MEPVPPSATRRDGPSVLSPSSVTLPTGEDLDLASHHDGTSEDEDLNLMIKEEEEEDLPPALVVNTGPSGPSGSSTGPLDVPSNLPDEIPIHHFLAEMDSEKTLAENGEFGEGPASMAGTVTLRPASSLSSSPERNQRPVSDVKLQKALDGQEPTVRNLIMTAIGVMKSRKARPDTKRICTWIHRRYGRPYMSISEELERLVMAGELARVDYKGSVSFRINSGRTTEGDPRLAGIKVTKRKRKEKIQVREGNFLRYKCF